MMTPMCSAVHMKTFGHEILFDIDSIETNDEKMIVVSTAMEHLSQELELLQQFDTKDVALSSKRDKQDADKKEVIAAIAACKAKISVKQTEAKVNIFLFFSQVIGDRMVLYGTVRHSTVQGR